MKIKNIFRGLGLLLLLSIMFNMTVFADDLDWNKFPLVSPESVLLPPEQNKSTTKFQTYTRGNIITSAILSISNAGEGKIGVSAQTLMYVPIDRCRMRIYLDRWYEEKERWEIVDSWDFDLNKEDYPNGLTVANLNFDIINQPTDCYYRLRGMHVVWLNGVSEGFSTETHGVYITK